MQEEGQIVAVVIDEKSCGNVDSTIKIGVLKQIPVDAVPLVDFEGADTPQKLIDAWEKLRTSVRRISFALMNVQSIADSQAFDIKIQMLVDRMLEVRWAVSCELVFLKDQKEAKIYTFTPFDGRIEELNDAVRMFCWSEKRFDEMAWYQRESFGIPGVHDFTIDKDGNLKNFIVLDTEYPTFKEKFSIVSVDVDNEISDLNSRIKELQDLLDIAQDKRKDLMGDSDVRFTARYGNSGGD